MKKIVYIDLDGVCADFDKASCIPEGVWIPDNELILEEGFFENLEPIEGAIDALHTLSEYYDLYFLSTPQWSNPSCWKEKRIWVENHYGELMFKRLILTHHKRLLRGDYLIDDNIHEGFEGVHIHFGQEPFPTWNEVVHFLVTNAKLDKEINKMKEMLFVAEMEA